MPTTKPRAPRLESATARRKLPVRKKPFWIRIGRNVALGYRRCVGPGSWSVRRTERGEGQWLRRFALADDEERESPPHVLGYWKAVDAARKLARREPGAEGDETRPVTVGEALDQYQRDLAARGGDQYNAHRARIHASSLLSKPVALLRSADMSKWRDSLIEKGLARDTINRVRTCLRAALSLASKRDRRIQNKHVWQEDLEALPNATEARNVILGDDVVSELVAKAYEHDPALGLFVETIAQTGSRSSQAVRLTVADLDVADRAAPRLMMPRSGKGHAHKRAAKMAERVPVPINIGLAMKLREAAAGRASDARLLVRSNGEPWLYRRSDLYREDFAAVVTAIGLDSRVVTPYALRHSAISRGLLRGVPLTLIADMTDTSEREIRKHYAKLISHHSDAIARRALLQPEPPAGPKVVPLSGR